MSAERSEGLPARILELGEELRREGVSVGTSEMLDAFEVLQEVDWTSQEDFREGLARDALRRFEALLRRELERSQIERTGNLPPARPLGELDRALPSGPLADLAAVHRVVAQLRRRLATQGMQNRGHRKHAHVDVRRTMRASLQTG